jgi:hypothetical protein
MFLCIVCRWSENNGKKPGDALLRTGKNKRPYGTKKDERRVWGDEGRAKKQDDSSEDRRALATAPLIGPKETEQTGRLAKHRGALEE